MESIQLKLNLDKVNLINLKVTAVDIDKYNYKAVTVNN